MKQNKKSFEEHLKIGRAGEEMMVNYLTKKGYGVIPSYEFTGQNDDKAPKMKTAQGGLVLPDLDVGKSGMRIWVEVKHYHGPAYNRTLGCEVHGISRRLYEHYEKVSQITGAPVHIAIIEKEGGNLLVADLLELEIFDCMCSGCKSGSRCKADVKKGVYWRRSDMTIKKDWCHHA